MVTRNSGSLSGNTPKTMGRIKAAVPQEVPMANPMKPETTKITAGRNESSKPMVVRKLETNSPVPSM